MPASRQDACAGRNCRLEVAHRFIIAFAFKVSSCDRDTNRAPGHSAVTISPRVAMDSSDCIPFGRGLVARLIGPARGCSTAAAPAATAAGMLHGGDEPQHAGQSSGVHSARPLHRQDVAVAVRSGRSTTVFERGLSLDCPIVGSRRSPRSGVARQICLRESCESLSQAGSPGSCRFRFG
jgi:hypothetical protein